METRHVFGPVPSRRLGRSLGVDLVPYKTCTYYCIYCQLGRTTHLTLERKEWFPLDGIIDELKDKLASRPDWITMSGSGEPTLYSRLGELIARIRSITNVPVAVLTNGSLLWQEEVRKELMDAPRAEDIADFRGVHGAAEFSATRDTVMDLLSRRPCTIDDIAGGLGIHRNEAVKYVEDLLEKGLIDRVDLKGKTCFRAGPKD